MLKTKKLASGSKGSSDNKASIVALDIGGTKIVIALFRQGKLQSLSKIATPIQFKRQQFINHLLELVKRWREQDTKAIGISFAGQVNKAGLIVQAPNLPQLDGVNLAKIIKNQLGLPAIIANDGDCYLQAELSQGKARGQQHVLAFVLGTGVGGAFTHSGQARPGQVCEPGHLLYRPGGRACYCGHKGCVEQYLGGKALARQAGMPDAKAVFLAAKQGNKKALRLVQEAGEALGWLLNTAVKLVGPELVILGGSMAAAWPALKPFAWPIYQAAKPLLGKLPSVTRGKV